MPRLIDHLVLGTQDLDATGELFAALGFTVGGRNIHPWGTHNRIIQFADRSFLELITVGEAGLIPPHVTGHFSLGAHVRDALAKRPGLSMLALQGQDARADAATFKAAGLGEFAPFDFERKGHRPDGSEVHVAFSLAFARDERAPDCALFTCQHHFPQNFWSEATQRHANGATGVTRVTIVAENPSDHHIPLAAFTGNREMRATSTGIEVATGHGVIEVVTDAGFAFRYGVAPPAHDTPVFAGFSLALSDIAHSAMIANARGLETIARGDCLILLPNSACQTAIRLEPAGGLA
jgi:hypothetical protein